MTITGYTEASKESCIIFSDGRALWNSGSYHNSKEKLFRVNNYPFVLGFSGNANFCIEIEEAIQSSHPKNSLDHIANVSKKSYDKIKETKLKEYLLAARREKDSKLTNDEIEHTKHNFSHNYSSTLLLAGYDGKKGKVCGITYEYEMVRIDGSVTIGCGSETYTILFENHMRPFSKKERQNMKLSKCAEITLKCLQLSEKDHVGGEPSLVLINGSDYRKLDSKESLLLKKIVYLDSHYELFEPKFVTSIFEQIVDKKTSFEEVFETVKRKMSTDRTYEMFLLA